MSNPRFAELGGVMRGQARTPARHAQASEDLPGEMPGEDDETEDCEAGNGGDDEETTMTTQTEQSAAAGTPAASTSQGGAAQNQNPNGQANSGQPDAAAIRAEERQRIADVFASEAVTGRELAAAELLANSDMTAGAIVAMLPKLTPAASADEGAQMLAQMRNGTDVDLGTGDDADQSANADNHGWGKAMSKAARLSGRKAA